MPKENACIFLISARKNLLKTCLSFLDKNYNNQFNYPILIFYHGTKYDDINFRKSIESINPNTKYSFHKIKSEIPEHLKEEDMFWNLPNNGYAKKFGKERLGYLHAIYFFNNFMNFEELKNFDYMMRIDDDSWFKNKMNFDMFEELDKQNKLCGTAYSWNHVNKSILETRQHLFDWIKNYVEKYNVIIKNKNLEKYLNQGQKDKIDNIKCNKNFHSMKILSGNCNIYNRQMFETEEWTNFLEEYNKLGGGYRYRWGDNDLISMFYYLHLGDNFMDLKLKKKNLYNNQIDNKWDCVFDKDLK